MLNIENLNYKDILHDISIKCEKGKIYGVIGPNGSGKTTLLKNISGVWNPTAGKILWNGINLQNSIVTLVPQTFESNFFDFSVYDIVSMGFYPRNGSYDLIKKALDRVDSWQFHNKSINALSAGERQRVLIARALVTKAPLMLFDEPASALDIRYQKEIYDLIKKLKQETIILISMHDLVVAEKICDEVILLNKGRCIDKGPFDKTKINQVFFTRPSHP